MFKLEMLLRFMLHHDIGELDTVVIIISAYMIQHQKKVIDICKLT